MLVPQVQLIPSQEQILKFLRETGALKEGRFEYRDGTQANYYFQMPIAMRYHGNARILNVALSRKLRKEPEVLAALPNCAVVTPSMGGIPVAFGIREALNADQIFWAERVDRQYQFRQYMDAKGLKCILVDDLVRTGSVMTEFVKFMQNEAGAEIIAIGSLVHFTSAQMDIGDIPYYSLLEMDMRFYKPEEWPAEKADIPLEKVWF